MIPGYRFLEVVLASLLNTVPFLVLAVYPFRRQLRFPVPGTVAAAVLFGLLQIATDLFGTFSQIPAGIPPLITTGLWTAFYFSLVKDRFGRLLFVLLVLSNAANLVKVLAKCLEGFLFGSLALESCRWSFCLCLVMAHVVVTVPLAFFIRRYFIKGIPIQTSRWCYLWLIPGIFYVIWYYHLYFVGNSLEVALDHRNALFLLFINIAALLVYHTVILLLMEQKKATALLQENHLLSMGKLQYDNLQQRINEARQARHDLRHHTYLIREYLREGKFQELEAYLDNYTAPLLDPQSITYCQHYVTNTLLGYFVSQARAQDIETDVFVQLPETIRLPETAISVVLGNLLENAIDACREVAGEKKITIRGKAAMEAVFFEITNTYNGNLNRSESGGFLSTKDAGQGIGLESVRQMAQRFGGMLELDPQGNLFRASVLLPEQFE